MRLWWSFRSPYVLCFSIATEPVNVPGGLIDFQPAPVIAVTVLFPLRDVIAVKRNMTGDSSAIRERKKTIALSRRVKGKHKDLIQPPY